MKKRFWEELDEVMRGIPQTQKILLGGDFNGDIGTTSGDMTMCMVDLALGIEMKEKLHF